MNYRHTDELDELATSRLRWMIAAYVTLALCILTLVLAWLEVI
jgi:hypothetical protein